MSLSKSSSSYGAFYDIARATASLDERLAQEIHRQRIAKEAQQQELNRIIGESEEIRQFKSKINNAYVNKERAAQIANSQIKKLYDIKRDAEIEDIMIRENYNALKKERLENLERKNQALRGRNMLFAQMEEKRQRSLEAYHEYMKEKDMIDAVVQKTINEDLRSIEEEKMKKKQIMLDMTRSLDLKKEKEYQDRMNESIENRKRLEYLQEKERKENAEREQRRKIQAQKELIRASIGNEEEKNRIARQMDEDLKHEVEKSQIDRVWQVREILERQKRSLQKEQLREAEKEGYIRKMKELQDEARTKEEYGFVLKENQAKEIEKERLYAHNRKLREKELKREADKLAFEKWKMYKEDKERELMEVQRKQEEEYRRQMVIRQEKERLMREHLPNLNGFLSREMLGTPMKNPVKSLGNSPSYSHMKKNNIF